MSQKSSGFFGWIVGAIVLAIIGGIFYFTQRGNSVDLSQPFAVTEFDQVKGPADAPLTIIEYSDFECPACANYYPILKQLNEDYPNELRVVYRHFPLISIHPLAMRAAYAAEAAGLQGRFWEMHDVLFQNQTVWVNADNPEAVFSEYASILQLDMQKFESDMKSKLVERKVRNDRMLALNQNLRGTPTLFLNGESMTDLASYDDFKTRLNDELTKLGVAIPETGAVSTEQDTTETTENE
jgi:protein-disulfide isomerase